MSVLAENSELLFTVFSSLYELHVSPIPINGGHVVLVGVGVGVFVGSGFDITFSVRKLDINPEGKDDLYSKNFWIEIPQLSPYSGVGSFGRGSQFG